MRPGQHHVVDEPPVLAHVAFEAAVMLLAVNDLDSLALQKRSVGFVVPEIVGPELHDQPEFQQAVDKRRDGPRPGIAIRLRNIVVDDQDHLAVPRALAGLEDVLPVGVVLRKLLEPACHELLLIQYLVGLDAASSIGPVRDPLVMHHYRKRCVVGLPSEPPQPE